MVLGTRKDGTFVPGVMRGVVIKQRSYAEKCLNGDAHDIRLPTGALLEEVGPAMQSAAAGATIFRVKVLVTISHFFDLAIMDT